MRISDLTDVLNTIDGDPREFVAAFEADMVRNGSPLPLYSAVTRWNQGVL